MRDRFVLIGLLICAVGCVRTPMQPNASEDLAAFLEVFPGRYDSGMQVLKQRADGLPDDQRNYRRHSIFRRVSVPALGQIVVYAEQYRDGDPENIYRQRLYEFTPIDESNEFRLRVHIPKNPERWRGAYRDPDRLASVTPADTIVWPGCDVFWTRAGNTYTGTLRPGECRFESPAYGQTVVLEETLVLTDEALAFADRGLSLDGTYLFGMKHNVPTYARRAHSYLCRLTDSKSAAEHAVWLHDQDGRGQITINGAKLIVVLQRQQRVEQPSVIGLKVLDAANASNVIHSSVHSLGQSIRADVVSYSISCRPRPDLIYADQP